MSPDTTEIKCGKCGAPLRIHIPQIGMAHDHRMSQVTILPSWSLDERECKQCGSLNAPMIMKIETDWVAYENPAKLVQAATPEDVSKIKQFIKPAGRG